MVINMNNIIPWSKFFDHIYCIHSTLYPDRISKISDELQRVGILNSGIFSWKISSGDFINHCNYDLSYYYNPEEINKNKFIDLTKNYVEIFEESIINNYQKILVLEDDIYFLKDLQLIKISIENLPDFDICKFDWNCFFTYINQEDLGPNTIYDIGSINDYYCHYTWTTSSGLTGYSNRIMQVLLERIKYHLDNKIILPFDNYLARLCDLTSNTNKLQLYFHRYYPDRQQFLKQFDDDKNIIKLILSKKHIGIQIGTNTLNGNSYENLYYFPSDYQLCKKYGDLYKIDINEYNYTT